MNIDSIKFTDPPVHHQFPRYMRTWGFLKFLPLLSRNMNLILQ